MFEKITEKLTSSFKKLRGNSTLTEQNIEESLKEIRMSLLEADVNYKVVKNLDTGKAVSCSCKCWSKGKKQCAAMRTIG